ncbi:unnamed protein product, partial [Allacma fusca]
VTYTSRALESDTYKKNMAADRIVVSEFGTAAFPDPCKTIFQRFQTKFRKLSGKDLSDSCSVSVGYYGDQLYAMTETNAEITAEIAVTNARYPSYYHSFGIPKDKLIFIESPWRLDLLKTFKALWTNQSFDSTIVWKPELKVISYSQSVLVIDTKTMYLLPNVRKSHFLNRPRSGTQKFRYTNFVP